MDIKEIITAKLKELGADGLCNNDICSCGLDDLCPCENTYDFYNLTRCVPAKHDKTTNYLEPIKDKAKEINKSFNDFIDREFKGHLITEDIRGNMTIKGITEAGVKNIIMTHYDDLVKKKILGDDADIRENFYKKMQVAIGYSNLNAYLPGVLINER